MRRFTVSVVILALVVFALFLTKDFIVKEAVEKVLAQVTDFKLTVRDVHVSLFHPVVNITGVKLTNPPDFPEPDALDIERIYVNFDIFSLFGAEIHFREVILDIPKVAMIKKATGESNMDRLQKLGQRLEPAPEKKPAPEPSAPTVPKKEEPAPGQPQPSGKHGEPKKFRIDSLTFRLGEVKIRDYTHIPAGEEPKALIIKLNVDQTYKDVTSIKDVGAKIGAEVVTRTAVFYIQRVGDKFQKEGDGDKLNKLFQKLGNLFKKTKSE